MLQLASALTQKWQATRQASLKLDEMGALVEARTSELRHVALHDRLTGLPNRELLMDRLSQAVLRHQRDGRQFGVLFLDFDRFKAINDSLGHRTGDLLLSAIADRLQQSLRRTDSIGRVGERAVAARLGGDEFVVLLDDLRHDSDAARVATRLLDALTQPWDIDGRVVHVTASVGITTSWAGYDDPHAVLRDADTAMYRAKLAGKARYVIFDQSMHDEAIRRLRIEADLRAALGSDQFMLHYQPIVSLPDATIRGFEALVRWRHPSGRLVSPAEFVTLAEENGCILPLGRWVLEEACRTLGSWRRRFPHLNLSMSVNLSRRQFSAPDLVRDIERTLEETGVVPDALTLEITESAIMEDRGTAIRRLGEIRAMGVGLEIDDFGTGYSSLSCLHQFPVTGLKIDREFVQNLSYGADRASVVRTIVSLAHVLGVRVVAEGIEAADQLAGLLAVQCDFGQGHYFSYPVDLDRAEQLLAGGDTLPRT